MIDEREPSEVLPDENRTVVEDEVPKEDEVSKKVEQVSGQAIEPAQDGFLTKEMFVAQFRQLADRARAAGLNPIQMLVKAYAKRGEAILGSLLAALEDQDITKKKK